MIQKCQAVKRYWFWNCSFVMAVFIFLLNINEHLRIGSVFFSHLELSPEIDFIQVCFCFGLLIFCGSRSSDAKILVLHSDKVSERSISWRLGIPLDHIKEVISRS